MRVRRKANELNGFSGDKRIESAAAFKFTASRRKEGESEMGYIKAKEEGRGNE